MHRSLTIGLLLLALAGLPARSGASSCPCQGSFLENAVKADLVVRGMPEELVGTWGNGAPRYAKIRIFEVFKGEPPADFVVIEGDDGMSLRLYASHFQPFTDWLLALRLSHILREDGKETRIYHVSVCGSYAVRIEKGAIFQSGGCVEPAAGTPLAEFTRRLTDAVQAGEEKKAEP
ncbi:MAG TPA: hypothetical protein VE685_23465 [Thermoanaerobaculia bacterium]|nr:hypothetical protein [Thermoanaerobaculia bacterium]